MSKWIWYYGDYELYHSLRMQVKREEYDYGFPPFWKLDDCYHNVKFLREVVLDEEETITVLAHGTGHVEVDGKRYPFQTKISLSAGCHKIVVYAARPEGLPSVYVMGETVVSDENWLASCYGRGWSKAGDTPAYTGPEDNPEVFPFCREKVWPKQRREVNGGVLYDFGRELFGSLCLEDSNAVSMVFYGESEQEALDQSHAYLRQTLRQTDAAGQNIPWSFLPGKRNAGLLARAFRYVFLTGEGAGSCGVSALYEYLPLEQRGEFRCSDERLNQIWDTAAYTFRLNCREFLLDGIKRDRWIWSGDAYQSYFINRYLFFDGEIARRTILALRGKDPVEQHINTILDYSFYWIMSVYDHYVTTADKNFLERIYPKMESLMEFCLGRCDENGFAGQVEDDWIFIDWADMDKTGPVCAEQMLFRKSLETMAACGEILGRDMSQYRQRAKELGRKIQEYYWREEKGAFVDSFSSGQNHVTRHANIFAILFGYVHGKQAESIVTHVLRNPAVSKIKTPYFKFYELEAACMTGEKKAVTQEMVSYWGGMLDLGATTFWEEYDPEKEAAEQLSMYADKFGKSLCHAWGASPIYILGRYYLGVSPTSFGYETFLVEPDRGGLAWIQGKVPINGGYVSVKLDASGVEVCTDKEGGILQYRGQQYALKKNETLKLP